MRYFNNHSQATPDASFYQKVKAASRANIDRCYQCLTCSLSCPAAFAMDYLPNQVIRMVKLGLKQQTLASSTLWVCVNCEACATRCPNDVEILKLMDTLREIALQEGASKKEEAVTCFHRLFLANIKRWGRQHELSLILQLKMKTRDFFSDLGVGIKMLWKGKLKLIPPLRKKPREVNLVFHKIDQRRAGGEQA